MTRSKTRLALLAGSLALIGGGAAWMYVAGGKPEATLTPIERDDLGLMTTLPIYWGEAADIGAMLQEGADEPNWVRQTLERRFTIVPLDTLDGLAEAGSKPLRNVLLAQPRALSPGENVALDQWVRNGGRVLVLADPMLTGHSEFGIGDRRRPQDVVLLSPILARWGLELTFDEAQPAGERTIDAAGGAIPVNLAGAFRIDPGLSEAPGECTLSAAGLIAECKVGKGRVTVLADAAVLEDADGRSFEMRHSALTRLEQRAFP